MISFRLELLVFFWVYYGRYICSWMVEHQQKSLGEIRKMNGMPS